VLTIGSTSIYTRGLNRGRKRVMTPADTL